MSRWTLKETAETKRYPLKFVSKFIYTKFQDQVELSFKLFEF